jgi:hypothetical protein
VLIDSLFKKPGRSTLLAAIDESMEWSQQDYLLARISDEAALSNYLFIQANSSEDSDDIPVPEPLPRPGTPVKEEEPEYEFASGQEVATFFQQMNSM